MYPEVCVERGDMEDGVDRSQPITHSAHFHGFKQRGVGPEGGVSGNVC